MADNQASSNKANPGSAGKEQGQKIQLWEFTCRTCNGKFAANVYEPRFCLLCGSDMHFKEAE